MDPPRKLGQYGEDKFSLVPFDTVLVLHDCLVGPVWQPAQPTATPTCAVGRYEAKLNMCHG